MGYECQLIRQVTQKLACVNPKSVKIGNRVNRVPGFELEAGLCRVRAWRGGWLEPQASAIRNQRIGARIF